MFATDSPLLDNLHSALSETYHRFREEQIPAAAAVSLTITAAVLTIVLAPENEKYFRLLADAVGEGIATGIKRA